VRAYLATILALTVLVTLYRVIQRRAAGTAFREVCCST
jgi:hypothetical protein